MLVVCLTHYCLFIVFHSPKKKHKGRQDPSLIFNNLFTSNLLNWYIVATDMKHGLSLWYTFNFQVLLHCCIPMILDHQRDTTFCHHNACSVHIHNELNIRF